MASSRVHRDLRFHADHLQSGPDVAKLQRAINKRARARGITQLKVDGQAGRQTIAKGREVATALGVGLGKPGIPVYVQRRIRNPLLRTPAQLLRARRWQEHRPAKPAPVKVNGNKVTGGTKRQRIVAAAMQAAHLYYTGKSHRFYSQAGRWSTTKGITGESPGYRSDCSQFATAMYKSAGVKDPNANSFRGGYTGTMAAHGRYISRSQLKPGDFVFYGPAPHHHVELYVGPGDRTVGHGSPPVDYGDIYMISDPHFVTYSFLD